MSPRYQDTSPSHEIFCLPFKSNVDYNNGVRNLEKQKFLLWCKHWTLAFGAGARFSKAPETFWARKAIAKFATLRIQSYFIHRFLIWKEVLFIQDVSGVYASSFLDTDELNMALRARKVSGAFEKRVPVPRFLSLLALVSFFALSSLETSFGVLVV